VDQSLPIIQENDYKNLQVGYMNLGKITLITPPDKLFNMNLSYLLVKPSNYIKQQFQSILSRSIDDLNVFMFDEQETDISWMLSVAQQVDIVIVDVDNCDTITQKFVTFLLAQPNTHYITKDETTPYNLISKNRIWDLDQIVEQFSDNEEEDDDES
jgi:hypothetical protein